MLVVSPSTKHGGSMQLSDNIQRMIYNRMTLDKGTINYHVTLPDGTQLGVRETVTMSKYLRRRLNDIESTLSFKWDRWHLCWNIVHKRIGEIPYIVMVIQNPDRSYQPIDERTFEQIKKSIWWSSIGIKRQAKFMENEEGYAREKIDNDRKEKSKDFARELAYPMMNYMRGNDYSYGGSNFMFPGVGESKMNVGERNA